jgi:hypothetical protein
MLQEYIRYLTASASSYARELGYLKESIAFEARAQTSSSPWKEHFEKCRQEVLQRTEGLPVGTTIWVLGSGSLFETPWQELLEKGYLLKLVDLYHPAHVKAVAKKHKQVQLVERDMTGFRDLAAIKKILLKVPEPPRLAVKTTDFVISSNIWSQLAILPLEYLSKNTEVSVEEKIQWAKNIQKNHFNWIMSFGCSGLIFSDFEIHHLNFRGEIVKIEQQPFRPHSAKKVNEWDWRWSKNNIRKMESYLISRNA